MSSIPQRRFRSAENLRENVGTCVPVHAPQEAQRNGTWVNGGVETVYTAKNRTVVTVSAGDHMSSVPGH